jgi:hypothetical protein
MDYNLLTLLVSIVVSVVGFVVMGMQLRGINVMVTQAIAINERNERMTAKVLTMLAGIEEHDQ